MFRNNLINIVSRAYKTINLIKTSRLVTVQYKKPIALCVVGAFCEKFQQDIQFDEETLGHEFLIRQATTVNVNAATQLITVTLVAIQETSERLRESLTKEICLVRQAIEWGENGTPPQHWDQLIAVQSMLTDLKHNLHMLSSYMEYAEKLATVAAEISYLTGNTAASDAICERIDQACRTWKNERSKTNQLQQESLELQQKAIASAPKLEEIIADIKNGSNNKKGLS